MAQRKDSDPYDDKTCGCQIVFLDTFSEARAIQFCALHEIAPAMLEVLEQICDGACWSLSGANHHKAFIDAAKIEAARTLLKRKKA